MNEMEPLEPQRDQYTVEWICALPIEAAVAKAMLDKHYRSIPSENANDSNSYVLGRIGEHNVVIASLPAGVYGTTSAATTATNMLASFPNIRFGLLVGIGGGIPSEEHDIRLGDVVVSKPYGDVVQIDLGKVTGTGFKRTGSLNQPPVVLLTALAQLKADHILDSEMVPLYLSEMYGKFPALKKTARYLGLELDKLFQADYNHQITNRASCQDCDLTLLVSREPRETDDPVIHYGAIASGNQVIKDSHTRDRLRKEHGIICFEMEAAGIMNNFPCLVVRGICDYSDSHKSKGWQGYAAATAAAFAKEWLCTVPVLKINSTRRAVDILQELSTEMTNISSHIRQSNIDKHYEKIHKWLSPPDPSANYNRALENRHPGSGAWFLGSELFSEWKSSCKGSMWLHGLPGCGKTVLSASIIEYLQRGIINVAKTNKRMVLYFYFDFSDKKKQLLNDLAHSLVSQLYHQDDDSRAPLDTLFSSCRIGQEQPTLKSLLEALSQMLKTQTEVYLVLDALDECTSRKDLLCWLETLKAPRHDSVRCVLTSRKEEDIDSYLSRDGMVEHIVAIQTGPVNEDIHAYIRERLQSDPGLGRWQQRDDVQSEIEDKLMEKADGMFRWATCQLDVLARCTDRRMLRKALNSLPATLYETYARTLKTIPREYKSNAIRVLQFLIYSAQPLKIKEVVDAIAVNLDEEPPFERENRMPRPEEIVKMCSSLITIVDTLVPDKLERRVQLAHFSVQQYLVSGQIESEWQYCLAEINAKATMAKVCLAYCATLPTTFTKKSKEEFPFAGAAAEWIYYAAVAEAQDEKLRVMIEDLFLQNEKAYHNWLHRYIPEACRARTICGQAGPLYWASLSGFVQCVRSLLSSGVEINAVGRTEYTALCAASSRGHVEIVKLLLESGAALKVDTGAPREWREYTASAISVAVDNGQEAVVMMLLNHGADVNAYDNTSDKSDNLLLLASLGGFDRVVQMLLDHGASMETQGRSALEYAGGIGDERAIKILLDKGVFVDEALGPTGDSALIMAAYEGQRWKVQLLIDKGADVDSPSEQFRDALGAALYWGHDEIVQLLLDEGARGKSTSLQDKDLLAACIEGDEPEVRSLLGKGADANARRGGLEPALHLATSQRHAGIIHALLDKGADVHVKSWYQGSTALHQAIDHSYHEAGYHEVGYPEVVDILIKAGSDLESQNLHGKRPLTLAIENSHGNNDLSKIATSLIQAGADLECVIEPYLQTPLIYAAKTGSLELVKQLIDARANVEAKDIWHETALHHAVSESRLDVVKVLIDARANLEAQDMYGNTALHRASSAESDPLDVVKALIDAGSNLEAQDNHGNTALHSAANYGYLDVVKLLVVAGADLYGVNDDGETPLDSAEKVLGQPWRWKGDLGRAERWSLLVAWIRSYQRGEVDVDS